MSLSLFSLAGKSALVTGGNGGLGLAITLGLRDAGARVAITGRSTEKNAAVAAQLGADGAVFALDVRDEEGVAGTMASVIEHFGRLDVLVNNAGMVLGGSILEMPRVDWDAVIATNLTGSFLCAKHAARAMVDQGQGGKIINIGSIYSLFGTPIFADYGASKAGILGLTRALAIELAPFRIQVNAILPGWYETDMTREEAESDIGDDIRRKTAAGRWGQPEDLVGTSIFLASSASDFVTGAHIPVDGGYLITERFVHA